MTKYEYYTASIDVEELNNTLNKLGAEGWKLQGIWRLTNRFEKPIEAVLMRPLPDPKPESDTQITE